MIDNYLSFGRYPKVEHFDVQKLLWTHKIPDIQEFEHSVLPYGYGKSYGDSCLNEGGILLDTKGWDKLISFDPENLLLECEAGVTLADCLEFLVPRGYFLASTPGTKHITVGGAIANDVHGKNHHRLGTFGCHVKEFELVRSDRTRLICSPEENSELFKATIGGLGLTGLITKAKFSVVKIPSPFIEMESIKFDNLEEFYEINDESKDYDFSVSWVDSTATSADLGRGLFGRGNFASFEKGNMPKEPSGGVKPFPFDAPFINPLSVGAFNTLYYNKQINKKEKSIVHYEPFFYPLDAVDGWNKAYGKKGFLQYQFVLPFGDDLFYLKEIMRFIVESGISSFLTVLKTFGNIQSPGMLSFPRPGITLAIDFRMTDETLHVLEETDRVVREAGGVIYPAKDARMSADNFKHFYPQWEEFKKYKDPKFSSSFWRRVTNES